MDIFTTALGLTKQRNGYELTEYLVQKLTSEFNLKEALVFEVFGLPGNYSGGPSVNLDNISIRRFDHDLCNERLQSETINFNDAIKTCKPVSSRLDDNLAEHIVIPIKSSSGPLRLVVVNNMPESPESRLILFQITELYESIISLHDGHERDQLTGLLNRQTFNHYFQRAIQSIVNTDYCIYLAMLDIDHFKRVNDTFGHLYGDEVLLHFSNIMEKNFRYNDALFRFGGEEFIALIKCNTPKCAEAALNRFRQRVENFDFPGVGKITVSAGFVCCQMDQFPSNVIALADTALYNAKDHGRNQVVDYEDIKQTDTATQGDIDLF